MPEETTTLPSVIGEQEEPQQSGEVVAFDVGIKTLATGVNEQGGSTPLVASKAPAGTTNNWIESDRSGTSARRNLDATST